MVTSASADAKKLRVLVVDDLAVSRALIKAMLEADYDVDLAEDGEAAVRAAARTTYDLILMDIMLPGADGYASASMIRAQGAPPATKIVALSVQSEAVLSANAGRAGMNGFISRPIAPAVLVRRVAEIMAQREPSSGAPSVWDRSYFDTLAIRLGHGRTLGYLSSLKERLSQFVAGCADGSISTSLVPGRVHDMRSIAGMFGFEELLHICSEVQKNASEDCVREHLPELLQASGRAIAAMDLVIHGRPEP